MIIPANDIVAEKLAVIPLQLRVVLDDVDYHIRKTCDDDIIVYEVRSNEIIFDLPKRSKENGAIQLCDIINKIWVYDKNNLDEKVADVSRNDQGWFFRIRICPDTTNLNRDYLQRVIEVKQRRIQ